MSLKNVTWDRFSLMIKIITIVNVPLVFIIPDTQAFTFHNEPHFLSKSSGFKLRETGAVSRHLRITMLPWTSHLSLEASVPSLRK